MLPKAKHLRPLREFTPPFIAILLLILTLPLTVLSALAMACTSRRFPIISLPRIGKGGRIFTIYKIRTLKNPDQKEGGRGPLDSRATPTGRLLRICAIDEIPQLINLIKGDMVLCGPRAIMTDDLQQIKESATPELFELWYAKYTSVKPGFFSTSAMMSRNSDQLCRDWASKLERDILDIEANGLKLKAIVTGLAMATGDVMKLVRAHSRTKTRS